MYQLQVLFLILCFTSLTSIRDVIAIQGGIVANRGEYMYSAVLNRYGIFYCSGAVIGRDHIITAAQCLFDEKSTRSRKAPIQVVVGTTDYKKLVPTAIVADVEKFYIPLEYKENDERVVRTGDIAILKLRKSLDLTVKNPGLSKVFLVPYGIYEGKTAHLTGFGWNWSDNKIDHFTHRVVRQGDSSGKLRAAVATILPLSECQHFNNDQLNGLKHVCARVYQHSRDSPEGACTGDLGAPLVLDGDSLLGVLNTYDTKCNESVKPQVYTNVEAYREFIERAKRDERHYSIYTVSLI